MVSYKLFAAVSEYYADANADPDAARAQKLTQSAKTRRRKIAHVRSRTADSGIIRRSSVFTPFANAANLGLSDEDGGASSPGSPVGSRIRRVASEPRVVNDLDLTQRGLAKLESTDFTEVYLASEDETGMANSSEASDDARSVVQGNDGSADTDSGNPFSMRWKLSRRSNGAARKKKRHRRRKDESVQHSYFRDDNGELRDEYGFKVEDNEPEYLCPPPDSRAAHASVPHDTKKRMLSREALKRRQRRVWSAVIDDFGGSLSNIPGGALERWRKYYAMEQLDDSADRYLLKISSPLPSHHSPQGSSAAPPEAFYSPRAGGSSHRKQFSLGSASQQSQDSSNGGVGGDLDKDSPRRSSGGAGVKSRSSFGHHVESVVRKLRIRKRRHDRDDGSDETRAARSDSMASHGEAHSINGRGPVLPQGPGQSHAQLQAAAAAAESASASQIRHVTSAIRHYGIPPRLRREVWLMCSGALEKQRDSGPTEQYEYLVACATSGEAPEMGEIIERDLHRTFPTNYHFENEEGITRMRRVLTAYSLRNEAIGYCQSMNFLVAVLLLHMDENLAFWVLASIVEDLVPGHYTKQMTGMHVDQRVFESLVKQKLPKLYAHLESFEFPLEFVTYQWFLCLFVNSLPLETTLRIWDCFLHEGVKALFRAGIAILMILQKDILACDSFQDVYACISLADNIDRKSQLTAERVLKIAYDSIVFRSFPSSRIAQLRSHHLPEVMGNLGQQTAWTDFTSKLSADEHEEKDHKHCYDEADDEDDDEASDAKADEETRNGVENGNGELVKKGSFSAKGSNHDGVATSCGGEEKSRAAVHSVAGANGTADSHVEEKSHRVLDMDKMDLADSSPRANGSHEDGHATRSSHSHSEGYLPRSESMDDLNEDPAIKTSNSGSFHGATTLRRKVSRRPSTSFKYQLRRTSEGPMATLTQLGLRSDRSASLNLTPSSRVSATSANADVGTGSGAGPGAGASTGAGAHVDSKAGPIAAASASVGTSTMARRAASTDTEFDDTSDNNNEEEDDDIVEDSLSHLDLDLNDEDDEDEDDDGSDLPSEFSELLPSLAYVMSARQVELDEAELPRAASSMDAATRTSLTTGNEYEKSKTSDIATSRNGRHSPLSTSHPHLVDLAPMKIQAGR
ncbi:TBC1 domain family member 8B [Hondaea fermentalgiana]|uniref:TBC1 domain family member 8B n=1 Tax=Hondaea fermentalgiana TaxID=2315210 RepID=A0A2R5G8Y2_9STRA|nr:TBC1 domain family member 8B [Hondaea fermentalgiana]|eukprot:GBG24943.1 TBC1 domain family member 8B [Hondaea fermentalgiana]